MTTIAPALHAATVKHTTRRDPFLGRIVHEYRPVCACGWPGKLSGDPERARRDALRHGAMK